MDLLRMSLTSQLWQLSGYSTPPDSVTVSWTSGFVALLLSCDDIENVLWQACYSCGCVFLLIFILILGDVRLQVENITSFWKIQIFQSNKYTPSSSHGFGWINSCGLLNAMGPCSPAGISWRIVARLFFWYLGNSTRKGICLKYECIHLNLLLMAALRCVVGFFPPSWMVNRIRCTFRLLQICLLLSQTKYIRHDRSFLHHLLTFLKRIKLNYSCLFWLL